MSTSNHDPDTSFRTRSSVGVERPQAGLTVIIVTYNSIDVVGEAIISLSDGLAGCLVDEVMFVDNASTDGTPAEILRLAPDATLVQTGMNAGYAAAINAGIATRRGSGPVLVLNPDTRLQPGALGAMLACLDRPRVGIVVPRMTEADGQLAYSLRRFPSLLRAVGESLLGGRLAGRHPWLGEVITSESRYERPGPVDWATGAAWLMSAECIDAVGDWDESFFLYSEETDFAIRAGRAGFLTWYEPASEITHIGGEAHTSPELWALLTVNRVVCFGKWHGRIATLAFFGVLAAGSAVRGFLGRKTHQRAFVALVRWLWRGEYPLRNQVSARGEATTQ